MKWGFFEMELYERCFLGFFYLIPKDESDVEE